MLAVADTSSINYLLLVQCETLLPALSTRVVIPPLSGTHCKTPTRRRSSGHGWPSRLRGLRYNPSGRGLLRKRCRT